MANAVLDAAREKREKAEKKIEALMEAPAAQKRALTDDESAKFEKLEDEIRKLDKQIKGLEKQEARSEKATAAKAKLAAGESVIRREPGVYRQDASVKHGEPSYMRDLAAFMVPQASTLADPAEARARLQRNWHEIQKDAEGGEHRSFASRIVDEERRWGANPEARRTVEGEFRTNPNTTAGTGGEFVPPLWLVSQYAPFMRAGRVIANRVSNKPLPPGIDVINVPKITTGSLTGIQTANAAPVISQDIVTTSVSANVRTIAGQEDISLQLLEQSPIAMDGVVFDDLTRDYDKQLDTQVISGSGSNGQHQGVLTLSGNTSNTDATKISLVNCTATTFYGASGDQYLSLIAALNFIETLRYDNATAIWAHPRRVNGWALASDANHRPLFNKSSYGQFANIGTAESSPIFQGVAGEVYGLPVVKDANMPLTGTTAATGSTSLTSGGSDDPVVVVKEDDLWLFEGTMRMRALPEILSGTLQIRFQVYAYSAFLPNRFAASIAAFCGAGTAAPF